MSAVPPRTTLMSAAGAAFVLLATGGCDLPTRLPEWDTLWDVTVIADTVTTTDILPDGMTVTEEGFVLESFDSESQVRLGEVCELCTCFEGPIPELEIAETDFPVKLPGGVLAVQIVRGTAEVVIHNEAGFDVLDNGEGNRGFLEVDLADSFTDEVFQTIRLSQPFPAGDSLELTFDIPPIELSSRIVARVSGRTPGSGCDDVELSPESGFRSRVTLTDVVSSSARVIVSDRVLAIPSRDFDLPSFVADRLRPVDSEIVLEVEVDSRVPFAYELDLSAAGTRADLFGERAALFTPLVLEAGSPAAHRVLKEYLLDMSALTGADSLYVSSESRVLGNRIVTFTGGESVAYRVRLRARVPSR